MEKKFLIIFLITLILFGILFRFIAVNKDFTGEEVDFVRPAEYIKNSGHPIGYHSEQKGTAVSLFHPPMYIYLVSAMFQFWVNEFNIRIINVIFSILTAGLIFLFCYNLLEDGKIIGLISSAFFLINYYILSSSILIDIDVLSTFFVFGFFFMMLMYHKTQKNKFLFLAGASMIFGLANRYPMMILSYFFVGIYYFINKDLDFKKYLSIGFISSFIAILIWVLYCVFIEKGYFFYFILHNFSMGGEQFSNLGIYLGSFALNISQFIRLFTFPATILMILSWFYLFKEKNNEIKILLIYVLSIFLFFILIPRPAFGYPRYFMTIFPGVSILIGIFLYKNLKEIKLDKNKIIIIALSFILSLVLLLFLSPQLTLYASNGLIKATNLPDFCFNLFSSLPLLFVFFVRKEKRKKIFVLILIALMLSYCFYFDIKFLSHNSHTKEVGNYLKEKTGVDEIIIAPKAVGYYAERKVYVNDFQKPPIDNLSLSFFLKYIKKSLENRKMTNEFFWEDGFYQGVLFEDFNPSKEELGRASYIVLYHPVAGVQPEKIIGDFYIYD